MGVLPGPRASFFELGYKGCRGALRQRDIPPDEFHFSVLREHEHIINDSEMSSYNYNSRFPPRSIS